MVIIILFSCFLLLLKLLLIDTTVLTTPDPFKRIVYMNTERVGIACIVAGILKSKMDKVVRGQPNSLREVVQKGMGLSTALIS
jgi:uncharacterized membrane protein